MRLLGAIVAGGRATRFRGDKGAALLNGTALIDHVANGLREHVDAVAIVGRNWPGLIRVADYPQPGMGPLGGLCGALRYASANGFEAVVMTPCDLLPVPDFSMLGRGPATVEGHEICGVWPCGSLASLASFIATAPTLSMKAWIFESGAVTIASPQIHHDLNTPERLESFCFDA